MRQVNIWYMRIMNIREHPEFKSRPNRPQLILFESPTKALIFLILIFLIQQLDGNVIGPKILGNSIGISAFWILFAILVAGEIFGLVGMVIGVPLFAVIYSIIKENVEYKLREKNLPTDTKDYM